MASGEDKQTLALLRRCDVLSDISADDLQVLLPGITMGSYRPRQVIYLPGDRAQGIHFLTQGRIKISKVTRDGKELTLAYRTEGDFFATIYKALALNPEAQNYAGVRPVPVAVVVPRRVRRALEVSGGRGSRRF